MAEYEVQARATRAKTERLKVLRLAKEAQAQTEQPEKTPRSNGNKRRTETRREK
jgi:hypothetical protein